MSLSLQASINTCKVDTGWASRIESDRFLNPNNMVCPVWDGTNSKGQSVCPDSFYTKRAGCNDALDRIAVENVLRPQYSNYVALSAAGIKGHIYGNEMAVDETQCKRKDMANLNNVTGNFGKQFGADVRYTGCSVNAYEKAMCGLSQCGRNQGAESNAARAASNRRYAGL